MTIACEITIQLTDWWKVALLRVEWYSFEVLTISDKGNEKSKQVETILLNTVVCRFEIQHKWIGKK